MSKILIKSLPLIALILLPFSHNLFAEDIEIYRGQSVGIRQNSVFLMDTSGSMAVLEEVDNITFDPTVIYPNNGFESNNYYYSNVYEGIGRDNLNINQLTQQFFPAAALVCDGALDALQTVGFYNGKFKRWDPANQDWYPRVSTNISSNRGQSVSITMPQGSTSSTALIECKADEGRHPSNSYVDTRSSSNNQYITTSRVRNLPSDYSSEWDSHIKYLYSGNFINFQIEYENSIGTVNKTRMEITQEAAAAVVKGTSGIRLGLMRFDSYSEGGFVDIAVDDIETISTEFENKINDYYAIGGTPLSESYYESALYFQGAAVDYGNNSRSAIFSNANPGYAVINTPSVSNSKSGSNYISPLTSACQTTSSIVIFTDGAPSYDTSANIKIQNMIKDITFPANSNLSKSCSGSGGCAAELAYYLYNFDQNDELPGRQVIRTFVIGGFFDESDSSSSGAVQYMEEIAQHGNGEYFAANNYLDIVKALNIALGDTADTPVTFVAPAVTANSSNSLEHLDQLYYAMFVPKSGNDWSGNLKSYRLNGNGIVVDSKGYPAIDSNGSFIESSRSYWTDVDTNDGNDVLIGGAASLLTANYKIYTHLSTTAGPLATQLTTATINKNLIGLASSDSDAEHQRMIDWANRISADTSDGTRRQMEDPIHSQPVVITYSSQKDTSGTTTQEGVVFVGTNSGYLHAFKADQEQFVEYFSYIPKELLPNIPTYINGSTLEHKTYGIDGPINYWHKDINKNAQVDIANGEKVLLYFGLRRGGSNYYALDVSDPENPKFAWQITGGISGAGFEKLGQSWSNMELAKVPWKGSTKVVLLFGAGYDVAQDNLTERTNDNIGHAIYMVDAETGEKLWEASSSSSDLRLEEMNNSITSSIVPIDYDNNGITDYFFASDVGGRVWRFDINKSNTAANEFATGGVIFDANGDNNTPYQRFYDAPSISYFSEEGSDGYLSLAIGSGFRAHPLDSDSQDSFYILKNYDLTSAPTSYQKITPLGLADINDSNPNATRLHNGWKLALPTGEKNLSKALTSNGDISFTTFSPTIGNTGSCLADIGSSYAYYIDLKGDNVTGVTGTPVITVENVSYPGILTEPLEVFTTTEGDKKFCEQNPGHTSCCTGDECTIEDSCESSGSVILSGTQTLSGGISRCDLVKKEYWLENK